MRLLVPFVPVMSSHLSSEAHKNQIVLFKPCVHLCLRSVLVPQQSLSHRANMHDPNRQIGDGTKGGLGGRWGNVTSRERTQLMGNPFNVRPGACDGRDDNTKRCRQTSTVAIRLGSDVSGIYTTGPIVLDY